MAFYFVPCPFANQISWSGSMRPKPKTSSTSLIQTSRIGKAAPLAFKRWLFTTRMRPSHTKAPKASKLFRRPKRVGICFPRWELRPCWEGVSSPTTIGRWRSRCRNYRRGLAEIFRRGSQYCRQTSGVLRHGNYRHRSLAAFCPFFERRHLVPHGRGQESEPVGPRESSGIWSGRPLEAGCNDGAGTYRNE